jgi:ABC-type uncharacterized transport system substrate-binding protein
MQFGQLKRRDFITLLGGAAVLWPLAARAQLSDKVRRIGVLMSTAEDDAQSSARIAAFVQGLAQLGWTDGRTVRIDTRWGAGDADRVRRYVAELVALAPDVILASGGSVAGPLLQATRSVPIVFTLTPDPVGAGLIASLARPGGNATGFSEFEYGISAKWLELLKQIAPSVTRAAVLRDAIIPQGVGQFAVIQAAAPAFRLEVIPFDIRDTGEIERAIADFARSANGGLIVTASGSAIVQRAMIVTLAARHKLPAVYFQRSFVTSGGLISYGPDPIDPHRRVPGASSSRSSEARRPGRLRRARSKARGYAGSA